MIGLDAFSELVHHYCCPATSILLDWKFSEYSKNIQLPGVTLCAWLPEYGPKNFMLLGMYFWSQYLIKATALLLGLGVLDFGSSLQLRYKPRYTWLRQGDKDTTLSSPFCSGVLVSTSKTMLPSSTFSAWMAAESAWWGCTSPVEETAQESCGRFCMQLGAQQREGAGDNLESLERISREIFLLTI